jgi:hypothetical protein
MKCARKPAGGGVESPLLWVRMRDGPVARDGWQPVGNGWLPRTPLGFSGGGCARQAQPLQASVSINTDDDVLFDAVLLPLEP